MTERKYQPFVLNEKDPISLPEDDADIFLREQGIVPLEEREQDLATALNARQKERLVQEGEGCNEIIESVSETASFKRLAGLRQLGGKFTSEIPFDPSVTRIATSDSPQDEVSYDPTAVLALRSAIHTRFDHSLLDGKIAEIAGIKLGFDAHEVKTLMMGGLLHDLAHPALSHLGDELLAERGKVDHEARATKAINGDEALKDLFARYGINEHEVCDVILEKGKLGALQKIFDTLSYLIMDCAPLMDSSRLPKDIDFSLLNQSGAPFIDDMKGMKKTKTGSRFVVGNPHVWQELMEIRAWMMQNVYLHPFSRMLNEGKKQLIRLAIEAGHMTIDEVEKGTDDELLLRLQSLVQLDPGAARMGGRKDTTPHLAPYKELYGMAMGDYNPHRWERRVFGTKEDAQSFLNAAQRSSTDIAQSFIVPPPFDYIHKQITVSVLAKSGGYKDHVLQAQKVKRAERDEEFTVFMPL